MKILKLLYDYFILLIEILILLVNKYLNIFITKKKYFYNNFMLNII